MGTEWTECAAVLDRWSGISDFKAANVRCIRLSSEPLTSALIFPSTNTPTCEYRPAGRWHVADCCAHLERGCERQMRVCALNSFSIRTQPTRSAVLFTSFHLNLSSNQMSSEEASEFLSRLLWCALLRFIFFTLQLKCKINAGWGF